MKSFFDTSVLIPAFLEDHEQHRASLALFLKATKRNAYCGAHSLAEVYATLTRLHGKHRLGGDQVLLLLGNIRERLTIVALDAEEYHATIADAAAAGAVGGAIYDALLARCALKVESDVIYTWNVRHFQQLGPQVAGRIRTP